MYLIKKKNLRKASLFKLMIIIFCTYSFGLYASSQLAEGNSPHFLRKSFIEHYVNLHRNARIIKLNREKINYFMRQYSTIPKESTFVPVSSKTLFVYEMFDSKKIASFVKNDSSLSLSFEEQSNTMLTLDEVHNLLVHARKYAYCMNQARYSMLYRKFLWFQQEAIFEDLVDQLSSYIKNYKNISEYTSEEIDLMKDFVRDIRGHNKQAIKSLITYYNDWKDHAILPLYLSSEMKTKTITFFSFFQEKFNEEFIFLHKTLEDRWKNECKKNKVLLEESNDQILSYSDLDSVAQEYEKTLVSGQLIKHKIQLAHQAHQALLQRRLEDQRNQNFLRKLFRLCRHNNDVLEVPFSLKEFFYKNDVL